MEDILELLQERNQKVPVPLDLPDYDDLVDVEEAILISLPDEYKQFLLEASDIVCGSIEPATCAGFFLSSFNLYHLIPSPPRNGEIHIEFPLRR